jgi:hypothetical protein
MPTLLNQRRQHPYPSIPRNPGGVMTTKANVGSDDGRTVRHSSNNARPLPFNTAGKTNVGISMLVLPPVQRASRTTRTSPYRPSATSNLSPHKPRTRRSPSHSRPSFLAAPRSLRRFLPRPMPKQTLQASSVSRCAGCARPSADGAVQAPARRHSCVASRKSSCDGYTEKMSWL